MSDQSIITTAMVAIGDELLSGRTKDRNIGHLAEHLTVQGLELREVRIVADEIPAIVEAVNALRHSHDFVFTSGGIGPTHDDLTADAIGAAFELDVEEHPQAVARLSAYYEERGVPFTEARRRMTRTPAGASLIDNPVSVAPGFRVENVFVMAGIPQVFAAMLAEIMPSLPLGEAVRTEAVACPFGEGDIGGPLRVISKAHPDVAIGSYPRFGESRYVTEIVLRSRDPEALARALEAVETMVRDLS